MQLKQTDLQNNDGCILVEYTGPVTPIRKNLISRVHRGRKYGAFVTGQELYIYAGDLELQSHLFKLVEIVKEVPKKRGRKPRQSKIEVSE